MPLMTKTPPKHQWVETADGSFTLFSEEFREACHSSTGARTETLLHYIQGCNVVERIEHHSPFTILEVGFGLGMGFLTTLESLSECRCPWHFISLEIDSNLVEWFGEQHPKLQKKSGGLYEMVEDNFKLTVLTGDARVVLPHYLKENRTEFHAIYQDAFSHRRNPTLWTLEWFDLLRKYSSTDVILSTYSSSSATRKSLIEAGWKLQKGEKFGPKRSSTRAFLQGETDPDILLHLSQSSVVALSDDNVDGLLKK